MLQVASRSLLSSPSLSADCDLYYSPRFRTEERVEFGGWPVLGFRHIETMEDFWPQRRDLTGGTLDRLADVESFRIASEEEITNMVGVLHLISVYLEYVSGGHTQFDGDVDSCIFFSKWPSYSASTSTTKGVHGAGN